MGADQQGIIYGLFDACDRLFYIGQTITSIQVRLSRHLGANNLKQRTRSAQRLKSLRDQGITPSIRPIAYANNQEELDRLEIEWIKDARASGLDIVNTSDGGSGTIWGAKRSAITRARMATWRTGRPLSAETKAKMSSAKRGSKMPPRTAEHRFRLGNGNRGRKIGGDWLKKIRATAMVRNRTKSDIKLSTEKVIEIKRRLAAGESCASIARGFGVTGPMIGHIKHGRAWK